MSELPIEVVPHTRPQRFRWRKRLESGHVQVHSGTVAISMVAPLVALVRLAEEKERECQMLHTQLLEAQARVAELSEINGRVEQERVAVQTDVGPLPAQPKHGKRK